MTKNILFGALATFITSCATPQFKSIESIRDDVHLDISNIITESFLKIDQQTTLQDLLKQAALNNAELKAAFLEWQSELLKVYAAGTLPDAQLSFTHYIQEVETRVGPQQEALSIMQKLPWFGKLDLKTAIQSEKANTKKAIYEAKKTKLFSQIKQLYCNYYFLQKALLISIENKKLLASLEPVVRNKVKTGESSKNLIQLQLEMGKIEDRIAHLTLQHHPLNSRLSSLLNQNGPAIFTLNAQLDKLPKIAPQKNLLDAIEKFNPELHILESKKHTASREILLARKNFYPDFSIGLKVIETGEANNSPDDNGKDPVMATISMSLPLNQKKYGDLEKSAIKKYQASIHHKKNRQNELSTQLALTLFEFHDHHRKLTLYRDTLIPKARQSLKITLQAYRNNKADFLDLIDIQRQLLQFQLMKEKSFTEIHRQSAILEELTGGKHLQSGENHE